MCLKEIRFRNEEVLNNPDKEISKIPENLA